MFAALYTWARVKDISVQYMLRTFNCDHLATYFMIGQTEWTTFTPVYHFANCPGINSYNYPDGQLSKLMIGTIWEIFAFVGNKTEIEMFHLGFLNE